MYLKAKSGRKIALPNPEEDAAITRAALSDPDAKPLSDAEWEQAKRTIKRGRPLADSRKERISIHLSPEVLAKFRATGPGWQTRIDRALKEWLETHSS